MRLAAKVDENQREIVVALRRIGCSVRHLHQLGGGIPDLLVGFRKKTGILEVKFENGGLTPAQERFVEEWNGQFDIARTPEEAIRIVTGW